MALKLLQFWLLLFILAGSKAWDWNLGQILSIKVQPKKGDYLFGESQKEEEDENRGRGKSLLDVFLNINECGSNIFAFIYRLPVVANGSLFVF